MVSACLAGVNCRYDGGHSASQEIINMVRAGTAVPVCPEQLGGLPTPRPASEIRGGDGADVLSGKAGVFDSAGREVTGEYIRGAREALKIARLFSLREAVMKDKSPACGCGLICRGGRKVNGFGVCSAMLISGGITVRRSGEK